MIAWPWNLRVFKIYESTFLVGKIQLIVLKFTTGNKKCQENISDRYFLF